jgi:hypothetical protein
VARVGVIIGAELLRVFISAVLRRHGHEVHQFTAYAEVVPSALDLVVTNVVSEYIWDSGLPIIYTSGSPDAAVLQRCASRGFPVLRQPFVARDLQQAVRAALERGRT